MGLANATLFTKIFDFSVTSWMGGADFAAEAGGGLRWQPIKRAAGIFKVFWRQARVNKMAINKTDLDGGTSGGGQIWADAKGEGIDLDFSGLTLAGGLEFYLF
jgi:hypothetical protein